MGAAVVLAGTGCGEAFTATGGGTATSTATGGGGSTATGGGGSTATGGTTGGGGTGGTTVTPECMPNETQPCYTGAAATRNTGICKDGVKTCDNGTWSADCHNQVLPATEMCGDQLDSDCDGNPSNNCPCSGSDTQDCYPADPVTEGVGICHKGTQACVNGTWGDCTGAVIPQAETCNNPGQDNNCDTKADNIPGLGDSCDTGLQGVCKAGTKKCNGDQLQCTQNVAVSAEICDGQDNNCDGQVDNVPGLGNACQVTLNLPTGALMCPGALKCGQNTSFCAPFGYYGDDFSSDQGWNLDDEWAIGTAMASSGQSIGGPDPGFDHSSSADNKIAGVILGGNASAGVHGPNYLTSKTFDINKNGPVYLTYWRWLNAAAGADIATVEVSMDDGQNWTTLWTNNDGDVFDNGWKLQYFDLTQYKSSNFKIRFGWEVVSQGATVSSWNIDDIGIASCPLPG